MEEGFYWIQFNGLVQLALFLSGNSADIDRERDSSDYWLVDGGHEITHGANIKIVNGPLDIHV